MSVAVKGTSTLQPTAAVRTNGEAPTPATLAGGEFVAAREVVRALRETAAEIGVEMATYLHTRIPELHAADEQAIFEETAASCASNMEQLLGLLARGEAAGAMVVPQPAIDYAQGLVRRRIPLAVLLRSYRLGHGYLWDLTARNFRQEISREADLLPALEATAAFMFEYVDLISADLVGAYNVERDRWVRSAAAVHAETARAIIEGATENEPTASARLGYDLHRHHVGVIISGEPASDAGGSVDPLEREALGAAMALGCTDTLMIPAGAAALWAWFGSVEPPDRDLLGQLESYVASDGVRMAVGRPAHGIAGFRVTHLEAQQAARFWNVGAMSGTTLAYRAVEVVSLLASDVERARRFVANELGDLAAPTEPAAQMRQTLLAFLSCGSSYTHAAQALHMHHNTVYKRVRRAEELLATSVASRHVELTNALMLAQALGEELLPAVGSG
jgi:hypothetical protein